MLCRFLQFAMGISTFTEMLRTVTGLDFSDEELMKIGRRIYTLERLFNNRAGFGRGRRHPAAALLQRGIPDRTRRATAGCELDEMLDGYYAVRGWDRDGVPLPQTLAELGL